MALRTPSGACRKRRKKNSTRDVARVLKREGGP